MITLRVPKELDIRYNAPGRERKKNICVDPCIAGEVKNLWSLGIVTTGCCCGHNIDGRMIYIGVRKDFIPKMKKLGYKVEPNLCGPENAHREDAFRPKSIAV